MSAARRDACRLQAQQQQHGEQAVQPNGGAAAGGRWAGRRRRRRQGSSRPLRAAHSRRPPPALARKCRLARRDRLDSWGGGVPSRARLRRGNTHSSRSRPHISIRGSSPSAGGGREGPCALLRRTPHQPLLPPLESRRRLAGLLAGRAICRNDDARAGSAASPCRGSGEPRRGGPSVQCRLPRPSAAARPGHALLQVDCRIGVLVSAERTGSPACTGDG